LSSEAFPAISPAIEAGNRKSIQQLRLFGKMGESLLWRVDRASAAFLGRSIEDAPVEKEKSPLDDKMLLLGDRVLDRKNGFTLIAGATGACHAVPVDTDEEGLPLALFVKHYFALTEPSGALRIAATRLVDLGILARER
jgi:CRISPR-associated protein (TIGR03984 family)